MTDITRHAIGVMAACEQHALSFGVPEHLASGIVWYVYTGRPMGGFLTAVFANDLREAVMRAGPESLPGLKPLLLFIYNELPGLCHGSPSEVAAWIEKGGDPAWVPDSMNMASPEDPASFRGACPSR